MDETGTLHGSATQNLSQQILQHKDLMQLQIWIIPTLDAEPIESLAIRAVEKWKLGTEKKDNGLLVLISTGDRAMRIEVGQGLEGDIPDVRASRVINQILVPAFRTGKFEQGLSLAINQLVAWAGHTPSPTNIDESNAQHKKGRPLSRALTGLVLMGLFIFLSMFSGRRRRRGLLGAAGLGGGLGGWGGGGFGGGGFGGGGWSGGGGGFSGGGSSGRW